MREKLTEQRTGCRSSHRIPGALLLGLKAGLFCWVYRGKAVCYVVDAK